MLFDLRRLTRDLRKSYELQLVSKINENLKVYWRYVSSRLKTKPKVANLFDGKAEGTEVTTDEDKVEVLSKTFASVFTIDDVSEIPGLPTRWAGPALEDFEVTPNQVDTLI